MTNPSRDIPALFHGSKMRRFYRDWIHAPDLKRFQVKMEQTDLLILAEKNLEKEAIDLTLQARSQIEGYILQNPEFLRSLSPLPPDQIAPPLIQSMLAAASQFDVGPMAAVAGAIAEFVGKGLQQFCSQVIVENGGDIYANLNRPLRVSLLPWPQKKDSDLRIEIERDLMPLSICSSSAKIGHSLSFGEADLACIVARSGAIADAAATLAGNLLRKGSEFSRVVSLFKDHPAVDGGVFVWRGHIAIWGKLRLI